MVENMPFRIMPHNQSNQVTCWQGDPNCQDGHNEILRWFQSLEISFFESRPSSLNSILKGNIGESIAYYIGRTYCFPQEQYKGYKTNAHTPFNSISGTGIDIIWLFLAQNPSEVLFVLQELKTTTSEDSLSYANRLVDDYNKLFGENPNLTLQSRINKIKNELLDEDPQSQSLGNILRPFPSLADEPARATFIRLSPTLIYDNSQHSLDDAVGQMASIIDELVTMGWERSRIDCVTISFSDLEDRFLRLCTESE